MEMINLSKGRGIFEIALRQLIFVLNLDSDAGEDIGDCCWEKVLAVIIDDTLRSNIVQEIKYLIFD